MPGDTDVETYYDQSINANASKEFQLGGVAPYTVTVRPCVKSFTSAPAAPNAVANTEGVPIFFPAAMLLRGFTATGGPGAGVTITIRVYNAAGFLIGTYTIVNPATNTVVAAPVLVDSGGKFTISASDGADATTVRAVGDNYQTYMVDDYGGNLYLSSRPLAAGQNPDGPQVLGVITVTWKKQRIHLVNLGVNNPLEVDIIVTQKVFN